MAENATDASLAACQAIAPSLAYDKPSLVLILTLAAFLLALNVLHDIVDRLLYAGILAQVILGACLGAPLANILPAYVQQSVQAIGYLGLLLLVFEGGMSTRLDILSSPSTFFLALAAGCTGVVVPIALSMVLLPFAFHFTYLQSFVVGAALSSTSLGTTLAVISATSSRDEQGASEKAPLQSSIAEEADTPQPDVIRLASFNSGGHLPTTSRCDGQDAATVATTAPRQSTTAVTPPKSPSSLHPSGGILNTRVGTILIGAALLDDIIALVLSSVIAALGSLGNQEDGSTSSTEQLKPWTVVRPILTSVLLIVCTIVLARFVIKPVVPWFSRRRLPRVFVSNTTIQKYWPFVGITVWLAVLCAFVSVADEIDSTDLIGAFCAGAFMVYTFGLVRSLATSRSSRLRWCDPERAFDSVKVVQERILSPFFFASIGFAIPVKDLFRGSTIWKGVLYSGLMGLAKVCACLPILFVSAYGNRLRQIWRRLTRTGGRNNSEGGRTMTNAAQDAREWPSAVFLGFALVARGEIGFLIINIARQVGILSCSATSPTASQAFDVGVWAITLNTFVGPTVVGILLRANGILDEIEQGPWGVVHATL